MEITGFNYDELSQLETLLESSAKVSSIIDRLYILDITGKKESAEYDKKLQELKKAIAEELKEYQNANLSYQQCLKYAKLLSSQTNISIFDNKATNSLKHYNHRLVKRVINILMNFVQNNQDFHKNIISNSLLLEPNLEEILTPNNSLLQGLSNSFKVQMSLNNDITSMFLSFLEDHISQREYEIELTKVKYAIATTNTSLEQLILANKFNIPNTIFVSAQFMNELLQESELSYEIIRYSELKTKAQMEINKLIQIKDSDYSSPSINIDSIISRCYLRALLSLMKDEDVHKLEREFTSQIESPEYLYQHLNDNERKSENIILYCFKSFKYDKGRKRVLTTRKNNKLT